MRRRSPTYRVAVVISSELDCYREMLRGINALAVQAGDWHLDVLSPVDDFLAVLRETKPDGMLISTVYDSDAQNEAITLDPHLVAMGTQYREFGRPDITEVDTDNPAVGRVAAKYFLDKGFQSFVFVGARANWSDQRERGFNEAIQTAGHTLVSHHERIFAHSDRSWARPHYTLQPDTSLIQLLENLPKPAAVLTCNDTRGREFLELCLARSLRVPEDIAVLGVDNDSLECELAHPPLSSVAIPWKSMGYEAARLLDQKMRGQPVEPGFHAISPIGVIERQSTDVVAIKDADLSAAIRYIRENAHRRIGVTDVLSVVPLARRVLERRFREHLNRTPLEEIRRVRVDRAKQLLTQTELPMPSIAESCGFATAAWFSSAFHALSGETPSAYRARHRGGSRDSSHAG